MRVQNEFINIPLNPHEKYKIHKNTCNKKLKRS